MRLNTHTSHLHTRNRHSDANGKLSRLVYANGFKKKKTIFVLLVCCYCGFLSLFRSCCSPLSFMSLFRMQGKSRRTAILLCSCTAHRHTCTHARTPFHCHVSICSTVDDDDGYDDSHLYSSARSVS